MTALNKAIHLAGGQAALGRIVGVGRSSVNKWVKLYQGRVPDEHIIPIYLATGVTPHELRPDRHPTRFDNNDAIMEALAKAQKDGTSKEAAALYNIGLNPRDGVAVNLPKVYEKAAQLIESNKGTGLSQAILDSQGYGALGVDLHTANQADANKDKLTSYGQQFQDTSQALDISNKSQSSYQDATTTFMNNMDLVSNALTSKLASLNGPLGDLSTTIAKGLKAFIDGPNGTAVFDMIRDGLTDLSNWLSGPNFKSDMHDFADDVKAVVSALGGFVRFAADHPWLFGAGLLAMTGGGGVAASAAYAGGKFAAGMLLRNPWTLGFVPNNDTPTTSEEMKGIHNFDEKKWKEVADWQKQHPGETWPGNSEVVQHAQAARGLRNNNPGNLKFAGQRGATLEDGPNATHAKFNSMGDGLYALEHQLEIYLGRGRNTIDSIFDVYSKKNHEAYKTHVSKIMGIKPSTVITSENKEQMVKLMRGIISMENGGQANQISDQQLAAAWSGNHQKDARIQLQVGLEQTPGSDVGLTVKSQGVRLPSNIPMFVIPG
ncbi:YdaS family helix-turn-helix protein [Enterobacter sp. PTB]|uniref:YdaS family helix-turn-helix protein n=1 Tax=Enterobacter sp. PTB TaxID=3143437 RepID=UPI003DA82D06